MTLDNLEPHEERMIVEAQDLTERLDKLNAFINGRGSNEYYGLGDIEKELMVKQHDVMKSYLATLNERIGRIFTRG